jgi:WD domain, G-beta repeat
VANSLAASDDGRAILSGGFDGTARLWDVETGKQLQLLKIESEGLRCVAISPDGRRALTAGHYGPIHLWDLATGKEICSLRGHTMGVNSVAFSPDGQRAVSGSDDKTIRVWQLPVAGAVGLPNGAMAPSPLVGKPPVLPAVEELLRDLHYIETDKLPTIQSFAGGQIKKNILEKIIQDVRMVRKGIRADLPLTVKQADQLRQIIVALRFTTTNPDREARIGGNNVKAIADVIRMIEDALRKNNAANR